MSLFSAWGQLRLKIYQLHEFVSNSADMKTVPHHLTLTEPLIIQAPAESPDPDFPDRRFQPQSWASPLYVGRGGNAGLHLGRSNLHLVFPTTDKQQWMCLRRRVMTLLPQATRVTRAQPIWLWRHSSTGCTLGGASSASCFPRRWRLVALSTGNIKIDGVVSLEHSRTPQHNQPKRKPRENKRRKKKKHVRPEHLKRPKLSAIWKSIQFSLCTYIH